MSFLNSAGLFDAIPDSAIDSFEDQDIAEYTQYSRGTVSDIWSFAQSPTPQDGSYILESNNADGDIEAIRSLSGLPYYPESGNKYHYYTYVDGNNKTGYEFGFATQSDTQSPDSYRVRFDPLGEIAVIRETGGVGTVASTSFTDQAGQWWEIVLDWIDAGDFVVTCYDLSANQQFQFDINPSDLANSHSDGGIAWINDGDNGVSVYWDDLRQVADDHTP